MKNEMVFLRMQLAELREFVSASQKSSFVQTIPEHIVISLTTYHARFGSVCHTIKTLLNQTLKPNRICVYLDCNESDITDEMRSLIEHGVEYRFGCEDLKPHKKYYFAFKEFPESLVITVDDDVLYPADTIETLYRSYKNHPDCISARRVHKMVFGDNGEVMPYNNWVYECKTETEPSHLLFPTGVGGVLYPPHCLDGRVFDKALIKEKCLNNDDVWLKTMALLAGTKTVWVANPCVLPPFVEGSQDVGLCYANRNNCKNDVWIANMHAIFGKEILEKNKEFVLEKKRTGEMYYNFDIQRYWSERYARGGNSGAGSYNHLAQFKADVLNDFVKKNDVKNVIEWGCGDGNQLSLAIYPEYTGYDISKEAVERCRGIFSADPSKSFEWSGKEDFSCDRTADLTLSLDVIYHLVDDKVFDAYMRRLFDTSRKYVIIYSCNFEKNHALHVRCRKFTDWIEKNELEKWKLINMMRNKYPYDEKNPDSTSWSDFYFYERIKGK